MIKRYFAFFSLISHYLVWIILYLKSYNLNNFNFTYFFLKRTVFISWPLVFIAHSWQTVARFSNYYSSVYFIIMIIILNSHWNPARSFNFLEIFWIHRKSLNALNFLNSSNFLYFFKFLNSLNSLNSEKKSLNDSSFLNALKAFEIFEIPTFLEYAEFFEYSGFQ